jgi:hypothetical protein
MQQQPSSSPQNVIHLVIDYAMQVVTRYAMDFCDGMSESMPDVSVDIKSLLLRKLGYSVK